MLQLFVAFLLALRYGIQPENVSFLASTSGAAATLGGGHMMALLQQIDPNAYIHCFTKQAGRPISLGVLMLSRILSSNSDSSSSSIFSIFDLVLDRFQALTLALSAAAVATTATLVGIILKPWW